MEQFADVLSPLARDVLKIDPAVSYARLVVRGDGNEDARQRLENVEPQRLLVRPVEDADAAAGLLAGLWLWHDWLDESHRISQQIHSPTGSFWHAIMHRREGDFSNSKYWYARCEQHPANAVLGVQAASVVNPYGADKLLLRIVAGGWNPAAYVDLVELVHQSPQDPRHKAAVSLQQLEWRVLFEHCARAAAG